jgi:hypothetical protein
VLLVLWSVSSAIANPIFAFAIGVVSCLPFLWLVVGINPYLVVQVKDLLEVGVFNVLSFDINFCIIGKHLIWLGNILASTDQDMIGKSMCNLVTLI